MDTWLAFFSNRSLSFKLLSAGLVLAAAVLIAGLSGVQQAPGVSNIENVVKPPAISAGTTVHLSFRGGPIGIGTDTKTFDALANALASGDRRAYEHLFIDGSAFLVPDGVQALVTDRASGRVQVQILEGYHSGKSGWASFDWLKP